MALPPIEARLLEEAAREVRNPRPYLELADEYAASTRPASALWAYSEAEARAPSDAAIRLKVAAAVRQFGHPVAAEALIRSVLAGQGAAAAQERLDLTDLLISTGQPGAALAVLRGAGVEAGAPRGRAEEALGDDAAAAKAYQRAGAAGDPEGYERLARLELAAGQVGKAREALQALIRMQSSRPADLVLVAAVQAAAGAPRALDAALQTLLRAVRERPRDAGVYYQAALVFLKRGDRRAGLAQLERAVKLDPNHAAARGRLADLLEAMGQTARAHRERAAFFELKDQPDRSLAELRRAGAAGYMDDLERTLMTARTASELQQLPVAVKEAQDGLKRHPGDPNLMLQLGQLYLLAGSRAALERLCHDWMALHPDSGMPYWLLGRRAVIDTREEEAISLFKMACAKEPDRPDFYEALGTTYLTIATPENAARGRAWLEKAVSMNGRSAAAHQELGRAFEQAGLLEEARRQYLDALDLQPEQTVVLNNVAQVSIRLQRPVAARLFTELAQAEEERTRERQPLARRVRDHPTDAASRLELARFLIRNGQLEAARNQLERAAEPGPAAPQARALLSQVNRWLRVQNG
jgi:tetratricopeptide (TPR) repeat protein